MRRKLLVVALAALSVSGAIQASVPEYEASVTQHYEERPLKTLSLAPVVCPSDLDCDEFEQELVEQLADRTGLKIIEPKTVRDLMSKAGVTNLDDFEGRMIIGEALGVDAFAFVNVQKMQSEVISTPEHDKWKNLRKEGTVKRAELELRVLTRDGSPLVQVSGTANVFDTLRGLPSITKKLFAMMLERAWS